MKNKKNKKASPRKSSAKKAAPKRKAPKQTASKSTEIIVRVDTTPQTPTVTDLAEPIKDGKKMTIPKTWLAQNQLVYLTARTPAKFVRTRPGKGGQKFKYVDGAYVRKVLNYVFGWNWDFEIVEHGREQDHVWVLGRLTVRNEDGTKQITKTQFGRAELKYITERRNGQRSKTDKLVDYGNDLKAAATDSLKKCASELGIASDIYGTSEYVQETGHEPVDDGYQAPPVRVVAREVKTNQDPVIEDHVCTWPKGCGNDITKQVAEYSKKMYGRPLCREHQKVSKPVK